MKQSVSKTKERSFFDWILERIYGKNFRSFKKEIRKPLDRKN